MRVLMSGGGTGGHVTPIKYVAQAMKRLDQTIEIHYVGPSGDQFEDLLSNDDAIDKIHAILPAKYRRYPGSIFSKLFDIKTNLLNLRDFFFFWIGLAQSIWLVGRLRPNVMFSKGGSVSVPVGLAARLWRVPIVTHDSDTLPGKSNRLLAKWAVKNAVGMPTEFYQFDPAKMVYTGVPLPLDIDKLAGLSKEDVRRQLSLPEDIRLVVVSGGSLGALSINNVMLKIAHGMTETGVVFIHITGRQHIAELKDRTKGYKNYFAYDFVAPDIMLLMDVAADVVLARAGATTTAELSALSKASVIVPASQLEDQMKNAVYLKKHNASVILTDEDIARQPDLVEHALFEFLDNREFSRGYGERLNALIKHDGSYAVAKLLMESARS